MASTDGQDTANGNGVKHGRPPAQQGQFGNRIPFGDSYIDVLSDGTNALIVLPLPKLTSDNEFDVDFVTSTNSRLIISGTGGGADVTVTFVPTLLVGIPGPNTAISQIVLSGQGSLRSVNAHGIYPDFAVSAAVSRLTDPKARALATKVLNSAFDLLNAAANRRREDGE